MDNDEKADPEQNEIDVNDQELSNSGLNIQANEMMPPRGELSGQESMGNTINSVWIPEVFTYISLEFQLNILKIPNILVLTFMYFTSHFVEYNGFVIRHSFEKAEYYS